MTDELAPGLRRFEIQHFTVEEIDGYLAAAAQLMDKHNVSGPEARNALRIELIKLLSSKSVQALATDDILQVQLDIQELQAEQATRQMEMQIDQLRAAKVGSATLAPSIQTGRR